MNISSPLELPPGIWKHTKTGRPYNLLGVGSVLLEREEFRTLHLVKLARYSEDHERTLPIFLVNEVVRSVGQWAVDTLKVPLDGVGPADPLVIYTDRQNDYWVRPVYGPAGWVTPILDADGQSHERFTFVMRAAPWPM